MHGRALVGSLAVHAGALGLLVRALALDRVVIAPIAELPRSGGEPVIVVEVRAKPPPAEPVTAISVELVDVTSRGETGGQPRTTGARTAGAPSVVATIGTADAPVAPARHGRSPLAMRGPELHPGDAALESIAGTATLETPPPVSGKLEPVSGGTSTIHDRVTKVTVERDGTAHFHDKPYIDIHLKLPVLPDVRQDLRDIGHAIAEWSADPYAGERYGRTQDLAPHLQAEPGQCDTYGDAMCDDSLAPEAKQTKAAPDDKGGLSILGGNLDLTGYLMHKLHVGDPYGARKLKLLDDTRDERAARGGAFRDEQLARSAELMRGNLAQLRATPPAELHEALFELWDECTEGDGATGEAGQRARTQVIGWIRANLPAGHAGAFTDAEIRAFDARRSSTQHFTPYE